MKHLFVFLPILSFAQGGDTSLYSIRLDSFFRSASIEYRQLYIQDRSDELVESFFFNGSYYELRNNGWHKQKLTECDSHIINESPIVSRDKIEQSEVKLLVWTGCALAECEAIKFFGYNYSDTFLADETVMVKDFVTWYISGDKWIKSSHIIKEL